MEREMLACSGLLQLGYAWAVKKLVFCCNRRCVKGASFVPFVPLVKAPTGRRYFSPGRSNMSKAKCCVALGTPTNERIGRVARDPFSRSSPRPKWCGRSFRPRFSSLGENAFGSADSPCGRPPRVPRRFAIALVAAPWANIGPPRLGLLGDFVANTRKTYQEVSSAIDESIFPNQRKKSCATMRQSQYQFFNGPG